MQNIWPALVLKQVCSPLGSRFSPAADCKKFTHTGVPPGTLLDVQYWVAVLQQPLPQVILSVAHPVAALGGDGGPSAGNIARKVSSLMSVHRQCTKRGTEGVAMGAFIELNLYCRYRWHDSNFEDPLAGKPRFGRTHRYRHDIADIDREPIHFPHRLHLALGVEES
jgi:hypothetical protein